MRASLLFARVFFVAAALVGASACSGTSEPQSAPAPAATPGTAAAAAPAPAPATPGAAAPAVTSVGSAPAAAAEPAPAPAPVARELTVPADTPVTLILSAAVASDKNKVEDKVTATLSDAVMVDGTEVLPAGADVVGVVTVAEESGRVKGKAQLGLRFNEIRFAGKAYPIDARVSMEAEGSKGSDAKKGAIGGAAGAVVGGLLGGKKGAVLGGAAGAGGTVLATKGKEVELARGARLKTKLRTAVVVIVDVK